MFIQKKTFFKIYILKIFFNIITYVICFTSIALSQEIENQSLPILIHNYKNGVVHVGQLQDEIENKNIKWLGTAFLVDKSCIFATAKHIFKKADHEKLVIRFPLPSDPSKVRTTRVRFLYEDSKSDLAFLKIDYFNNQPCNSGELHSFPLLAKAAKDSLVGEAILIIGYPALSTKKNIDYPAVRQGIISATNLKFSSRPMILLDLFGVPGFSGSPVILKKTGQVMGVIFGPGPTKRGYGFEWATPIYQEDYLKAIEATNTN